MTRLTYIFTFLFLLSANTIIYGQLSPTSQQSQSVGYNVPDTVHITYHHFDNPDQHYTYQDSTLNNYLHQPDPARARDFEYLTLGNIGSSAYPILFANNSRMGTYIGQQQYELYNFTPENVKIFTPSTPIVNARFSPQGDESTFVIKTDFARTFRDGTSMSINYRRIKHTGEYTNQDVFHTNFAGALTYANKKKTYSAQLLFISNVNSENINGGVQNLEQVVTPGYTQRSLVEVNLENANRRNQERGVTLQQYWNFSKNMNIGADLGYKTQYFKYSDTVTDKSDFYGTYWKDARGVRQYITQNTFKASPYLIFKYKSSKLRTGIDYNYISIYDEVKTSKNHQLIAFGTGIFKFSKGLSIDYDARLGLGSATGLFDAKGNVNIDLKRNLSFKGGVHIFRHRPSYLANQVSLNEISVYTNDFNNPYGLALSAALTIPAINTRLSVKQSTINEAIYYDTSGLPQQYDGIFNAITATATHKLNIWKINLENAVAYQIFNTNLYGNPTLYLKHHLYLETKMYDNNLLLRIGGEVRYTPVDYTLQGFTPAVGAFSNSTQQSSYYPRADVYLSARISKFRAFFRYSNIQAAFINDAQYNVARHPQYDNQFRLGIAWMFLN